ncbi:FAD dependent oxidoreductase [Xylariaceae sp. FL1651]|nr:FAD dependent oxidoreductase [Xylariaceae sp. FL1651]
MEERVAIPVSLPRDHPTRSFWQLDVDEIADMRSTDALPTKADTIIIGSGITGAAVAFNLLSQGAKNVVMIEARQACSGATGRNGGHTKAASYTTFLHHQHEHGTEMAAKIARLELANIRAQHAFAREHNIDCDSNPCLTVDVVYDEKQWGIAQKAVKALQDAVPNHDASIYTFHSPEEVVRDFYCGQGGKQGVCGGISYEAGSMSAYKFTIGVLKLCLEMGLNLQTNTAVASVDKLDDGGWQVETPRGVITAKRVVMATNGYTAHLLKKFQGVIIPLRGHVTAQRPGRRIRKDGLPYTYSFFYEGGYDYMISQPKGAKFQGDIIIGGGLVSAKDGGIGEYGTTDDTSEDENIMQGLHETLPQYFGNNWGEDHPDGRIRKQWTGIMGYGPDGLPFVGEMPNEKDLWVCASFQGHGMVLCWMCAKALVEMMQGRDSEELHSWFPDIFRVSEQRFNLKFKGRMHTRGDPSASEKQEA